MGKATFCHCTICTYAATVPNNFSPYTYDVIAWIFTNTISGHLGLPVTIAKQSGRPGLVEIAVTSCGCWFNYFYARIFVDRRKQSTWSSHVHLLFHSTEIAKKLSQYTVVGLCSTISCFLIQERFPPLGYRHDLQCTVSLTCMIARDN